MRKLKIVVGIIYIAIITPLGLLARLFEAFFEFWEGYWEDAKSWMEDFVGE